MDLATFSRPPANNGYTPKTLGCNNGYSHTALGPVMDISRYTRIRQWIYPLFETPVFASDPREEGGGRLYFVIDLLTSLSCSPHDLASPYEKAKAK